MVQCDTYLGLDLGCVDGGPCLVGTRSDGSGVVDTSLQECLTRNAKSATN